MLDVRERERTSGERGPGIDVNLNFLFKLGKFLSGKSRFSFQAGKFSTNFPPLTPSKHHSLSRIRQANFDKILAHPTPIATLARGYTVDADANSRQRRLTLSAQDFGRSHASPSRSPASQRVRGRLPAAWTISEARDAPPDAARPLWRGRRGSSKTPPDAVTSVMRLMPHPLAGG